MFLYEDQSQELEVSVWDRDQRSKDDFMGRTSLDLSGLKRETTHQIWLNLEDGAGKLFLLVTISGDYYCYYYYYYYYYPLRYNCSRQGDVPQ